jgi:hypothetical protein
MYQYRQTLVRMRQGDSDREIARSKTMGRKKIAQVREVANARGWLAAGTDLPDDTVLAAALMRKEPLPLKRFAAVEKNLLTALPDVPPQLASWAHTILR